MDENNLELYEEQLKQVNSALEALPEGPQREELLILKKSIEELLSLAKEDDETSNSASNSSTGKGGIDEEFAAFMSEINELDSNSSSNEKQNNTNIKSLEGMKCKAPYKHQWGDVVYHNAMICSVENKNSSANEIEVRVLFTNPTHQEMLPCPYFLDSDCKFSDEKCRFSHGETVLLSMIQDYIEPKFEQLTIGSRVLAKETNNLWSNAVVKKMYNEKCLVQLESNRKELELDMENIFPLNEFQDIDSENDSDCEENDDVINMSLMTEPNGEALGEWEKHTKGIGSKMMEKMGYIIGTGLGKKSDGRIEPVSAVILPTGKSLDYCMNLREKAGGDKNLFSVERKMKRLQKRQEIQNKKAYEREQNKKDVFQFLNNTLSKPKPKNKNDKLKQQKYIQNETNRNLNVANLKNIEDIKRTEKDLEKIKQSLIRNCNVQSPIHKSLKAKLHLKQSELEELRAQNLNIINEQKRRDDKRKMSVF